MKWRDHAYQRMSDKEKAGRCLIHRLNVFLWQILWKWIANRRPKAPSCFSCLSYTSHHISQYTGHGLPGSCTPSAQTFSGTCHCCLRGPWGLVTSWCCRFALLTIQQVSILAVQSEDAGGKLLGLFGAGKLKCGHTVNCEWVRLTFVCLGSSDRSVWGFAFAGQKSLRGKCPHWRIWSSFGRLVSVLCHI